MNRRDARPSRQSAGSGRSRRRAGLSSAVLLERLQRVFHLRAFRPGQEEVVRSVLAGQHTLAIMPTGAGKSLCYQLPAVLLPGMTVVVSPLIALMTDQHAKLAALGLDVSLVHSQLLAAARQASFTDIANQATEFILTTPEQLAGAELQERLRGTTVDLFVIDEAHCISQWGHDFRPSYLLLADAIERLGRPTVLALTATASDEVIADIEQQLRLPSLLVINRPLYRPNLHYQVRHAASEQEKEMLLLDALQQAPDGGIVYCATVKHVETVAARCAEHGIAAVAYHGRMKAADRHAHQARFMRGDLKAIVATNAFGLGVDKPDVRFVIHFDLPASLDAYYQESGRAGRDGEAADTLLLYRPEDQAVQRFFTHGRYPRTSEVQSVNRALQTLAREQPVPLAVLRTSAAVAELADKRLGVALHLLKEAGIARAHRQARWSLRRMADDEEVDAIAGAYEARERRDQEQLDAMIAYAQSARCRWRVIREWFNDATVDAEFMCGSCDNCQRAELTASSAPASQGR